MCCSRPIRAQKLYPWKPEETEVERPFKLKEIKTNEYHRTYSYHPYVKNWFCKDYFMEDSSRWSCGDLLNSKFNENDWVCFPEPADIRFSIATTLDNTISPKLIFNLVACFEPPGYKDDVYIPQFLEPFQDRVRVIISPTTSSNFPLIKYSGDLDSSINKNNKETIARIHNNAKVSIGIHSGVHAGLTKASDSIRSGIKVHDFEMFARSCDSKTIYTASQQHCYREGVSHPYDIQHPDKSMHCYGHFPDYFSTPSYLAMGGLVLNTSQTYSLQETHGELNCSFNINLHQHLVSMSMWRWCANHGFTHDTDAKVSVITQNGMLTQVGLFKIKIPTTHTRTHIWNTDESILESRNFISTPFRS